MKEVWKDIKESNIHQVSNLGRIRSTNYLNKHEIRILKTRINKRGYETINLRINKKLVPFSIHRLVAIAFIANPNNLQCVNHKDEKPSNNIMDNLEWCTVAYNNSYGGRLERISNAQRGHVVSQETKNKISKANKGRPLTEETKKKLSIALKKYHNTL